jgi:hypothetical protein
MEVLAMKIFLLTIALTTLTGGLALANSYNYSACANSNSKACQNDRAAFAEHHGGKSPEQYNNHWYQGKQGRWSQQGHDWRWDGVQGEKYSKGHNGWGWSTAKHDHDRD